LTHRLSVCAENVAEHHQVFFLFDGEYVVVYDASDRDRHGFP
jgi:hypothetical protein